MIDSDVINACMKKCRTEKKLEKERGDVHQEGEIDQDERCIRCRSWVVELACCKLNAVLDHLYVQTT